MDNKRALNEEMAKLLTNGKHDSAMKLTDFLAACSNVDSSDIESFLSEDRNMTELPDGEEKWAVAPPPVPTPTPPPEEVQLEDNFPMAHRCVKLFFCIPLGNCLHIAKPFHHVTAPKSNLSSILDEEKRTSAEGI